MLNRLRNRLQHRRLALLLALGIAVGVSACSGVAFTVANAPALVGRFDRQSDIAYAAGRRQTLDVYVPAHVKDAPVIVFWYGGAWARGHKGAYRFVGATLAEAGYLAILPNYRLYPQVRFPEFVDDGALAVKWTQDHAAEYGGDPGKLFLMGHSAGAHMAALLALDGKYLQRVGADPRAIRGLIGMSGPYVLTPNSPQLNDIFAAPATAADWQPVQHVSAAAPPTLLLHGADDTIVVPGHAERLAAALQAAGVAVELKIYPGSKHPDTVAALSVAARGRAPVLDDIRAFIERNSAATPLR